MTADRAPVLIFTLVALVVAAIAWLIDLPWWAVIAAAAIGWIALPAIAFVIFYALWRIEGAR